MRFSDLFVPKYLHSDPKVRIRFINKTTDVKLLGQMVEKDEDQEVVVAARERLAQLTVSETS